MDSMKAKLGNCLKCRCNTLVLCLDDSKLQLAVALNRLKPFFFWKNCFHSAKLLFVVKGIEFIATKQRSNVVATQKGALKSQGNTGMCNISFVKFVSKSCSGTQWKP